MKKEIIYLMLLGLLISCDSDNNSKNNNSVKAETNKVALLKVDYLTSVFEGGNEIELSPTTGFTISSTYQAPGDFGSVQLFYEELNEKIFDGTIIWMGTGEVSYPSEINPPSEFPTMNDNLAMPDISMFENVMYSDLAFYPEVINYSAIWDSISNLTLVSNYMIANPNGKINLFLYTPSVGIGDPAEWDWYVILKN